MHVYTSLCVEDSGEDRTIPEVNIAQSEYSKHAEHEWGEPEGKCIDSS